MAIDLVEAVRAVLTPQTVATLARAAGLNEAAAGRLVEAAIPTVLAAFTTMAAAPGGARRVSDAVSASDPDILAKVAGGDADAMTRGTALLGQLLGGSGLTGAVESLRQFAGATQPAAQSILGAVAEAAIGVIGQQDPSAWSDGKSIAAFLSEQKSAIAAALPPEISRALAPTGIVAGLGDIGAARPPKPPSAAASAASAAANAAAARARATPPAPSGGFPIWAVILLVIVALVAIWWFVGESRRPAPATQGWLFESPAYAWVALVEFHC